MTESLALPSAGSADVEVDGRCVRLTSLDRVLWPRVGFTKGRMLGYYAAVAPALLAQLAGRPVTLGRFPGGVDADGFATTECRGAPEWVRTVELRLRGGGGVRRFCVLDDLPSLLWAANLSAIELHPYLGGGPAGEEAEVVVFDLDPDPAAPERAAICAARVALALRARLGEDGLSAFAMTTGSLGIHVHVPLGASHPYPQVRAFAADVARRVAADLPAEVTAARGLADRRGRVRIDVDQNHPRRSTIAPYSLRAASLPLVAAPVTWDELERAAGSAAPGILRLGPDEVLARLDRRGDPWAGMRTTPQRLPGGSAVR